jgi:hypothetical protein
MWMWIFYLGFLFGWIYPWLYSFCFALPCVSLLFFTGLLAAFLPFVRLSSLAPLLSLDATYRAWNAKCQTTQYNAIMQ